MNASKEPSFTLIELIVVIAIIAVLAAIVAPNAFRAIEKAKVARLVADVDALKNAALAYYGDVGTWPPDVCPQEDPGFITWDAFQNRCCGQNDGFLPFGGPGNAGYNNMVQTWWDGPYLEKFPPNSPWGGSYDYEYWPGGGWGQPPGIYVSVRPKYGPRPVCNYIGNAQDTDVPDPFEVKLQQMDVDWHHPGGVNVPSNHVICNLMTF